MSEVGCQRSEDRQQVSGFRFQVSGTKGFHRAHQASLKATPRQAEFSEDRSSSRHGGTMPRQAIIVVSDGHLAISQAHPPACPACPELCRGEPSRREPTQSSLREKTISVRCRKSYSWLWIKKGLALKHPEGIEQLLSDRYLPVGQIYLLLCDLCELCERSNS